MTEESNQDQDQVEDTSYLDKRFPIGLVAINIQEKQPNGKSQTVHKGNVNYGIIPLSMVIDGIPEPDRWVEVDLGDKAHTKTKEPEYDDPRANWLQATVTQRAKANASGRAKNDNVPAMDWRGMLEASQGPKFMSLLKEARGLYFNYLSDTDLPDEAVDQLASSFFGGETLKATDADVKERVKGHVDGFHEALDADLQAKYASVFKMVYNDIAFDSRAILF